MEFGWGSPLGLGAFFAGIGILMWGLSIGDRRKKGE